MELRPVHHNGVRFQVRFVVLLRLMLAIKLVRVLVNSTDLINATSVEYSTEVINSTQINSTYVCESNVNFSRELFKGPSALTVTHCGRSRKNTFCGEKV